ncbi:MAG: PASTA domain-containing protein [Truepera sp.]|nr:PASTA domain-containing protein [Truepera sp.]
MLLDGRYEIIAERPLSAEQTLFEATAADGTAVRIIWYTLVGSQAEAAFERYRQVLRALRREDAAALHDVVARPGATYVAWYTPPPNQQSHPSAAINQVLEAFDYRPEEADIRLAADGKPRVYGLAFAGTLAAPPPAVAAPSSPRHKGLAPWLLALAPGVLLALLGIVLLGVGLALQERGTVILPRVAGQEVNSVLNTLYQLGLQAQAEPTPSGQALGTVVGIDPQEGSQIRPGRTVLVRYAVPYGQLVSGEVPDLRGQQLEGNEVARLLQQQRLSLGEVARIPANVEAGTVLGQQPAAGSQVPQGSRVDLLVSNGPIRTSTFLPDLRGLSREDAFFLARVAGVTGTIEIEEVPIPRQPVGTVVGQNLEPGVLVAADSVTLRLTVVGSGMANFEDTAPTFIGLSRDEAEALAARNGLAVTVSEVGNLNLPPGVVLQDPPVGEAVSGTVRLIVNVPPRPLPQPNVTVEVLRLTPRRAAFAWPIEAGIPEQEAVVTATTVAGDTAAVYRGIVRGGQRVEGVWLTFAPGPITFTLTLNGVPYSVPLRVNP